MKTPFVGGHDRFEEVGASGEKNEYNLFCRQWGFKYFSFDIFLEKNNIFENNSEKLFLKGVTIFEGMERRTTKTNITFFLGNEVHNTVLSFFFKTPHSIWLLVLWAHLFPYLCFYWSNSFQKHLGSPTSGHAPTMWISWKSVQNCDL